MGGCAPTEALRASIAIEPAVRASCIQLVASASEDRPLGELRLLPPEPGGALVVAVYRGDYPETVALQAQALVGEACEAPLVWNGSGPLVQATFEPGIQEISL